MSTEPSLDSLWLAFIRKVEAAEEEFVQGRAAAFKSLWSYFDDVTLCGGFGGIEHGWQNVAARLDWVSLKYADGTARGRKLARLRGFSAKKKKYCATSGWITRDGVSRKSGNGL